MTTTADSIDAALLGVLQESLPFVERPFEAMGKRCGLSEDETLRRIQALKDGKVIRQISAIFDTRSLGYASSLVAARIAPEKIDAAVAVINSHPGVSHNYLRNHEFNLWYTIAVPPTSRLGLNGTVNLLHQLSGADTTRLLPTLRLFKIGVRFDVEGCHGLLVLSSSSNLRLVNTFPALRIFLQHMLEKHTALLLKKLRCVFLRES